MAKCVECNESYNEKRAQLGYRTCLDCGSPVFKPVVIPVAKSNYIVGTLHELKNNNHKGPRH